MPGRVELEKIADELLLKIRAVPTRPFSLSALEAALGVTSDDIVNAAVILEQWEYSIKLNDDDGTIAFLAPPDNLTSTEIGYQLQTEYIGQKIHSYRSVKSTNDIASELAIKGVPEGSIVTSEEQIQGRGRLGRVWHSPHGAGIYLSIILRPPFKPDKAPGISLMTALALADTIDAIIPGQVQIKWPNDILVAGKKAAGILTELSADQKRIEHLVVGVGINVNHQPDDFPYELHDIATSVRCITGKYLRRVKLLQDFLKRFEKEYLVYRQTQLRDGHERIRRYSSLIGQDVVLSFRNDLVEGRVVDIDINGALVLEKEGKTFTITSGEVTTRRPPLSN